MICKCVCVTRFISDWCFYPPMFSSNKMLSLFCNKVIILSPSLLVPGNLGCFKDNGDPTPLSGGYQTSTALTIQSCISFCRNQRFKVWTFRPIRSFLLFFTLDLWFCPYLSFVFFKTVKQFNKKSILVLDVITCICLWVKESISIAFRLLFSSPKVLDLTWL